MPSATRGIRPDRTRAELVVVHGEETSATRSSISATTRRVDEEDLIDDIKRQVAEQHRER